MQGVLVLILSIGVVVSSCGKYPDRKIYYDSTIIVPIPTKNKEQIVRECLALINSYLIQPVVTASGAMGANQVVAAYAGDTNIVLRKGTTINATDTYPVTVIYGAVATSTVGGYAANTGFSGKTRRLAAITEVQDRFTQTSSDSSLYRVHISNDNTTTAIPAIGDAPQNLSIIGRPTVGAVQINAGAAGTDTRAGWYYCKVASETQTVSFAQFEYSPTVVR